MVQIFLILVVIFLLNLIKIVIWNRIIDLELAWARVGLSIWILDMHWRWALFVFQISLVLAGTACQGRINWPVGALLLPHFWRIGEWVVLLYIDMELFNTLSVCLLLRMWILRLNETAIMITTKIWTRLLRRFLWFHAILLGWHTW